MRTVLQAVLAILVMSGTAFGRDQIRIVGSSTVYPLSTVVAERLGRRDGIKTPVIESTGTGGGLKLFCAGADLSTADIANASRKIKSSEIEECKKNGVDEIIEIEIGNDGIVLGGASSSRPLNLTLQQIWQAMAAKGALPKMWNEISSELPARKIEIFTPPPTSGTRDAWNELVMVGGCPDSIKNTDPKACQLMREDGVVIEAGENDQLLVQKLGINPEALAIFGFSYFDMNRDKISATLINGTEPTLESIQDYTYPVARPLYFYVKKAHLGAIPSIKAFMQEFTSEAAIGEDGYLIESGLVPLTAIKLEQVRGVVDKLTPLTADSSAQKN